MNFIYKNCLLSVLIGVILIRPSFAFLNDPTYRIAPTVRALEAAKLQISTTIKNWDEPLSQNLAEELDYWEFVETPNQIKTLETIIALKPAIHKLIQLNKRNENITPEKQKAKNAADTTLRKTVEILVLALRHAPLEVVTEPSDGPDMNGSEEGENELSATAAYLQHAQSGIELSKAFADYALGYLPLESLKVVFETLTHVPLNQLNHPTPQSPFGFPCSACQHLTRSEEEVGTYEICPVCNWEDDNVQVRNPSLSGGANQASLLEAQDNFRHFGAISVEEFALVRNALPNELPWVSICYQAIMH